VDYAWTQHPTTNPTGNPSKNPTQNPTLQPTFNPSKAPTPPTMPPTISRAQEAIRFVVQFSATLNQVNPIEFGRQITTALEDELVAQGFDLTHLTITPVQTHPQGGSAGGLAQVTFDVSSSSVSAGYNLTLNVSTALEAIMVPELEGGVAVADGVFADAGAPFFVHLESISDRSGIRMLSPTLPPSPGKTQRIAGTSFNSKANTDSAYAEENVLEETDYILIGTIGGALLILLVVAYMTYRRKVNFVLFSILFPWPVSTLPIF